MDRRIIADKLERLRRCVQRIEQKRPATLVALATDVDLQDILSVNLERAVQVCVDIAAHIIASREIPAPTTMAATFEALHALHILSPDLANSDTCAFDAIAPEGYVIRGVWKPLIALDEHFI